MRVVHGVVDVMVEVVVDVVDVDDLSGVDVGVEREVEVETYQIPTIPQERLLLSFFSEVLCCFTGCFITAMRYQCN